MLAASFQPQKERVARIKTAETIPARIPYGLLAPHPPHLYILATPEFLKDLCTKKLPSACIRIQLGRPWSIICHIGFVG